MGAASNGLPGTCPFDPVSSRNAVTAADAAMLGWLATLAIVG